MECSICVQDRTFRGIFLWKIFEISEIGMSVEAFTGKTTILAGIFASDINNT